MTPENPCLLLVVEDDSLIQEIFGVWQTTGRLRQSFRVTFARSCKEALDVLAADQFDVILLDLGLPDSKGLDTLDRIIEQVHDRTPVIVFSGSLPAEIRETEILVRGAADIVFKPGPPIDELMRLIHYAASRHRIRAQYLKDKEELLIQYQEAQRELDTLRGIKDLSTLVPGPGLQRLERIIGRIGKLAAAGS